MVTKTSPTKKKKRFTCEGRHLMETDGVWSINQNTMFLSCGPTCSQPVCLTEAHHTSFLNYTRQHKGREKRFLREHTSMGRIWNNPVASTASKEPVGHCFRKESFLLTTVVCMLIKGVRLMLRGQASRNSHLHTWQLSKGDTQRVCYGIQGTV